MARPGYTVGAEVCPNFAGVGKGEVVARTGAVGLQVSPSGSFFPVAGTILRIGVAPVATPTDISEPAAGPRTLIGSEALSVVQGDVPFAAAGPRGLVGSEALSVVQGDVPFAAAGPRGLVGSEALSVVQGDVPFAARSLRRGGASRPGRLRGPVSRAG
jgi:hypothetical protein